MKLKLEKQGKTLLASLSSVIVLALISSAVQAQEVQGATPNVTLMGITTHLLSA